MPHERPLIAVFSGPNATIQNSPPLLTSRAEKKVREDGVGQILRPQRLARPARVYIEAFSAHPLEEDARELYGAPDGFLDPNGEFCVDEIQDGVPVYVVELLPGDGLYMLPYTARRQDGSPWDGSETYPGVSPEHIRQTFYPDASRIYEEIDRFGLSASGHNNLLRSQARFRFFRAIPPAGYLKGLPSGSRPDEGSGDIAPERVGRDYFPYEPLQLRAEPPLDILAKATNLVQNVLASGDYIGAQWLESSTTIEETLYWLSLLVDTRLPIVGHSAQRAHGTLSADGDRNIVDGVTYIVSEAWRGSDGADRAGPVLIVDECIFAARNVVKTDARPGNYVAVGGPGGPLGRVGGDVAPCLVQLPAWRHTSASEVRLTALPYKVQGVRRAANRPLAELVDVQVRDRSGQLLGAAMPTVHTQKFAAYQKGQEDVAALRLLLDLLLASAPLAGFVGEGSSPYGRLDPMTDAVLRRAVYCGLPVVKCGRGNTGGFVPKSDPDFIAGSNLTASKARMLLMASLLRLGAPPPAGDPDRPTDSEVVNTRNAVARYQKIFDEH
jgi:L-asparaginase